MRQGREVDDNDQFHFNTEFSERLYRIKINAIQMKETVEENKKTNDQVLQDRQYQVGGLLFPLLYISQPFADHFHTSKDCKGKARTGPALFAGACLACGIATGWYLLSISLNFSQLGCLISLVSGVTF